MKLAAYVDGIGLLGPGFIDWGQGTAVLDGTLAYEPARTVLHTPALLPAAERRRTGRVVKLALAVALEATGMAQARPGSLASVFASSGGDGQNCHELCQALASAAREVSPTRFSNSVHNAASGYWSIATGATAESNVLSAHDASFGAGLLEALTQVAVDEIPLLLVGYDTEYPEPLYAKRPVPDAFGMAFVLSPRPGPRSLARLEAMLTGEPPDTLAHAALESVRRSIPAARSLPLLQLLACRRSGRTVLDYLDGTHIAVRVESCV